MNKTIKNWLKRAFRTEKDFVKKAKMQFQWRSG